MLFKCLDSIATATSMTLYTTDVAIPLGEEYRLYFVLEIVEIQLHGVLLSNSRKTQQS
jgi:hypothetical protein